MTQNLNEFYFFLLNKMNMRSCGKKGWKKLNQRFKKFQYIFLEVFKLKVSFIGFLNTKQEKLNCKILDFFIKLSRNSRKMILEMHKIYRVH